MGQANDAEYGFAADADTCDLVWMLRLQDGLDDDLIGINTVLIFSPEAPFGGMRPSGIGEGGGHQRTCDYLETKYPCNGGT